MTNKRLVFLCLSLSPLYLTLPPQTPSTIPKQFHIRISPNFPIFFLCYILLQEPQLHFTFWSPRFSSPSSISSRMWPHWPIPCYFPHLPRAHHLTGQASLIITSHSVLLPTFYYSRHLFPKRPEHPHGLGI